MTSMVPEILNPALLKLQEYMGNFYPEMAKAGAFPLDFWKIEDDDLFWEAIGYGFYPVPTDDLETAENF